MEQKDVSYDVWVNAVAIKTVEETHPNASNLFDAYGIICLKYYDMYKKHNIDTDVYAKVMIALNEGYIYALEYNGIKS